MPVDLPVSTSIRMRPTWARRQRRHYFQGPLDPPTAEEIADAERVISDPSNRLYAPALHLEALRIILEAK